MNSSSGNPVNFAAPSPEELTRADFAALEEVQLALSPALALEDALRIVVSRLLRVSGAVSSAVWVCRGELPVGLSSLAEDECEAWLCMRADTHHISELAPGQPDHLEMTVLQTGALQQAVSPAGEAQPQLLDVVLPLRTTDETIGLLRACFEYANGNGDLAADGVAADSDTRRSALLQALARHAAAAISGARLFQQLQNAKREWEVTFDGMLDGVCIERADGTILRANRALSDMVGLEIDAMLGQKREDLYVRLPEYQMLRPLHRVTSDTSGLNVCNGEFRFGSPERIIAETVFALRFPDRRRRAREDRVLDAGEGHGVCVLRDVTEQRRLQEQVLQSEKLAALGELVSGVAHELNNPLTTVVGYAQLLQDDPSLTESSRRQMGVIHTEAARASRIVQNLLAFARREEPRKTRIDINDVLRAVASARTLPLQAQKTRLRAEYAPDVSLVWGDAHQLQQVFLNIINNAHQAIQEWRGEGEIHLQTQAMTVAGSRGVRITISDNGPGIAPDHLRRIFDPFFTTKPMGEGTGLGMSISLGIVSSHTGRIWAESVLGHGARFFVELPGMDAAGDGADHEESHEDSTIFDGAAAQEVEQRAPAYHILVVDDEEPVVTLITEVLNMDGHAVTPAFNGAEALALLQERHFDFIVSDVRMPAVGGPTFFEILQTIRPDLLPRVMFVTGDTVSPSTQEFLRKAGRPMLAKPFDPERLRAMVNNNLKLIADEEAAQDVVPNG